MCCLIRLSCGASSDSEKGSVCEKRHLDPRLHTLRKKSLHIEEDDEESEIKSCNYSLILKSNT